MFESLSKNKGFVNSTFLQCFKVLIKPKEFQWFWSFIIKNQCFANPSRTLNPSTKTSQIGIWCSGTKKCSQRYEIDHFCPGMFSAVRPSEIPPEIPPGIPLELSLEIHLEIRFEIPLEIPPEILFMISWNTFWHTFWNTYWKNTILKNPHPQPPYQAWAWSYR